MGSTGLFSERSFRIQDLGFVPRRNNRKTIENQYKSHKKAHKKGNPRNTVNMKNQFTNFIPTLRQRRPYPYQTSLDNKKPALRLQKRVFGLIWAYLISYLAEEQSAIFDSWRLPKHHINILSYWLYTNYRFRKVPFISHKITYIIMGRNMGRIFHKMGLESWDNEQFTGYRPLKSATLPSEAITRTVAGCISDKRIQHTSMGVQIQACRESPRNGIRHLPRCNDQGSPEARSRGSQATS